MADEIFGVRADVFESILGRLKSEGIDDTILEDMIEAEPTNEGAVQLVKDLGVELGVTEQSIDSVPQFTLGVDKPVPPGNETRLFPSGLTPAEASDKRKQVHKGLEAMRSNALDTILLQQGKKAEAAVLTGIEKARDFFGTDPAKLTTEFAENLANVTERQDKLAEEFPYSSTAGQIIPFFFPELPVVKMFDFLFKGGKALAVGGRARMLAGGRVAEKVAAGRPADVAKTTKAMERLFNQSITKGFMTGMTTAGAGFAVAEEAAGGLTGEDTDFGSALLHGGGYGALGGGVFALPVATVRALAKTSVKLARKVPAINQIFKDLTETAKQPIRSAEVARDTYTKRLVEYFNQAKQSLVEETQNLGEGLSQKADELVAGFAPIIDDSLQVVEKQAQSGKVPDIGAILTRFGSVLRGTKEALYNDFGNKIEVVTKAADKAGVRVNIQQMRHKLLNHLTESNIVSVNQKKSEKAGEIIFDINEAELRSHFLSGKVISDIKKFLGAINKTEGGAEVSFGEALEVQKMIGSLARFDSKAAGSPAVFRELYFDSRKTLVAIDKKLTGTLDDLLTNYSEQRKITDALMRVGERADPAAAEGPVSVIKMLEGAFKDELKGIEFNQTGIGFKLKNFGAFSPEAQETIATTLKAIRQNMQSDKTITAAKRARGNLERYMNGKNSSQTLGSLQKDMEALSVGRETLQRVEQLKVPSIIKDALRDPMHKGKVTQARKYVEKYMGPQAVKELDLLVNRTAKIKRVATLPSTQSDVLQSVRKNRLFGELDDLVLSTMYDTNKNVRTLIQKTNLADAIVEVQPTLARSMAPQSILEFSVAMGVVAGGGFFGFKELGPLGLPVGLAAVAAFRLFRAPQGLALLLERVNMAKGSAALKMAQSMSNNFHKNHAMASRVIAARRPGGRESNSSER